MRTLTPALYNCTKHEGTKIDTVTAGRSGGGFSLRNFVWYINCRYVYWTHCTSLHLHLSLENPPSLLANACMAGRRELMTSVQFANWDSTWPISLDFLCLGGRKRLAVGNMAQGATATERHRRQEKPIPSKALRNGLQLWIFEEVSNLGVFMWSTVWVLGQALS